MVNAVRDELGHDVLAKTGALRARVNRHLGRDDLASATIRVALEQIPCTVIRATVLREVAQGTFHPKEKVVLAELFTALEHDAVIGHADPVGSCAGRAVPAVVGNVGEIPRDGVAESHEALQSVFSAARPDSGKLLRYAETASRAGIEAIREAPDEAIVQKTQAACVDDLLTPKLPLSEIPEPVVQMVTAMAL